jgi:hypothetical protein
MYGKRVSHVWCNTCNARSAYEAHFTSHLLLEWSAPHLYNILRDIRASTAFDTRLFMYCRCLALLARRKCAGPWITFGQCCRPTSSLRTVNLCRAGHQAEPPTPHMAFKKPNLTFHEQCEEKKDKRRINSEMCCSMLPHPGFYSKCHQNPTDAAATPLGAAPRCLDF